MCFPFTLRSLTGLVRYTTLLGLACGAFADTSLTARQATSSDNTSTRTAGTHESASRCNAESSDSGLSAQNSSESRAAYWRVPNNKNREKCFTQLQAVRRAWLDDKVKIIDVRSPQAYQEAHIPGAINLPEYAIRTKTYLKSEDLVLVNDGLSYESLIQTCQRLKTLGYRNVSVLAGGVQVWFAKKDAVVFDQWHHSLDNRISPRELFSALKQQDWLILTDVQDIPSVRQLLQSDHVVPVDTQSHALSTRLNEIQKGTRSRAPVNIAIITKTGQKAGLHKDGSTLPVSNPTFLLQGGLDGYRRYIAKHALQLARSERGPIIQRGCGS